MMAQRRGDLTSSIALIGPLFLAYEIGVLFAGNVNGADVVTRVVYDTLGRQTYLLVHAALAIAFLLWLRHNGRSAVLRLEIVVPLVLEAAIYAFTLGAAITLVLDRLLGMGFGLDSLINALGAGVHEELVFRLGVFGGLVALLRDHARPWIGVALALAVSSVVFSLAHHVGSHGEPFSQHAFLFRCLAGLAFGLICWFRSLAHAVYAHALYDILVYLRG